MASGSSSSTRNDVASLRARISAARPYRVSSRRRTFSSPMPGARPAGASPSRGLSMATNSRSPRRRRGQAQGPAVQALRDAVRHRVLHQRLQDQRRHQPRADRLLHLALEAQPVAEAHLLDREQVVRPGSGSSASGTRSRTPTTSVRRRKSASSTHTRRASSGRLPMRALIELEAVEQEVRLDLRPQRAQLGLAREDLVREGLGLRARATSKAASR